MHLFWIWCAFFLSASTACRGSGFAINANGAAGVPPCGHRPDSYQISRALSPSLESVPSLFYCINRKKPLPRVRLSLDVSLLLLLAGDISLNPGPVARNLRLGTVNARSMRDKSPVLSDFVVSKGVDLLGITETWLSTRETSADLAEMTPPGFSFFQTPRTQRRGGGVGLFVSSALKFTPFSLPTQTTFEFLCGKFDCGSSCLNILNIYRPLAQLVHFLMNSRTFCPTCAHFPTTWY